MPSSPKIPKELILEHALKMLIRDGYESINIKALAKEIGCSTQPISWHFGNMDGLRNALPEYAQSYAINKLFNIQDNAVFSFLNLGLTMYAHGLASYIATGVITISKEEARKMLIRVGTAFFAPTKGGNQS